MIATLERDDPRDRIDALLVDQARRWREGEALPVEAYLAEHPDLADDPDARLDLAYGELRARRRRGEEVGVEALAARFPDLRDELRRQVEVGGWAEVEGDAWAAEALGSRGGALGVSCDMFVPPEAAEAPLSAGDFVLGEALGSGGMGTVFRARQVSLGKPVALKVLRDAEGLSPEAVRRLLAEGKAAARLRHPRIVGVHGIGRFPDGSPFLVMDLVEGPSLADRLRAGPFAFEEAAGIVAEVAEALEHAHSRGVVHRDLKPSNILLDGEGRAFVTDFGLAKRFDDDAPGLTRPDQILGTPHYMAPEQADARWGPVGPRSDVYGLGTLLFALLSGCPPFDGGSTLEVLSRVASHEPAPSLRDFRPGVPEGLADLCFTCLSKDPAGRPHSALAVADALRRPSTVSRSSRASKPHRIDDDWGEFAGVTPRERARSRAPRLVLPAFFATLATFTALVGLFVLRWQPPAPPIRTILAPPPAVAAPPISALRPTRFAPPAAFEPFEITWGAERDRAGERESPIEHPAPLREGDRLMVSCRWSRPGVGYLFHLPPDGSVRRLTPGPGPVERVEALDAEVAIEGAAGTEYLVLVVAPDPVPGFILAAWEKELSIFRPLGALDADTVLVDAHSIGRDSDDHPAIARALRALPGRLSPRTATVSTLALPRED